MRRVLFALLVGVVACTSSGSEVPPLVASASPTPDPAQVIREAAGDLLSARSLTADFTGKIDLLVAEATVSGTLVVNQRSGDGYIELVVEDGVDAALPDGTYEVVTLGKDSYRRSPQSTPSGVWIRFSPTMGIPMPSTPADEMLLLVNYLRGAENVSVEETGEGDATPPTYSGDLSIEDAVREAPRAARRRLLTALARAESAGLEMTLTFRAWLDEGRALETVELTQSVTRPGDTTVLASDVFTMIFRDVGNPVELQPLLPTEFVDADDADVMID